MQELFFAFICTRSEYRDAEKCRRVLVGPMREYLEKFSPQEIFEEFPKLPSPLASIVVHRCAAAIALKDFCGRCGRCELSRSNT